MSIWTRTAMRRCAAGLVLAAIVVPWAPGRGAQEVRAASPSDTIVMAYGSAPFSIDPAISYDYAGPAIMRTIYEPLVRMKGTSLTQLEGVLADLLQDALDPRLRA